MKLSSALAAASLAAPPHLAVASQVVKEVKVVGSDAGACEKFDQVPGCDANFLLTAKEFADGAVTGRLHDVVNIETSIGVDEPGTVRRSGSVACLNIYDDGTGSTVAVVAGTWDEGDPIRGIFAEGDTWWTAASIDGEGTPYYTIYYFVEAGTFVPEEICEAAEGYFANIPEILWFEHVTGQVVIDKLACGDLRSKKKCGKFNQCEWDGDDCVENFPESPCLTEECPDGSTVCVPFQSC